MHNTRIIPARTTITVGAAARLLGLHPSTVRRALASGELEGYR
jgi:excisionase family DNA binding protein